MNHGTAESPAVSAAIALSDVARQKQALAVRPLDWLRQYGFVLVVYLGVTHFTGAHFMGDTVGYAEAIVAHRFFEFGHLLWFPLGWLLSQAFAPFTGLEGRMNVILALVTAGWIAGLLSVLLLHSLARRVAQREWVASFVTIGFIFSQGFLNFAQTGCSYIPGLSFLLGGIYLLWREENRSCVARGIAAGAVLAGAVGLWFPYSLSVPAALVSPLFIFGMDRHRWRLLLWASLGFSVTGALIYGSAAALQGIYTFTGLREWILSSGHGVTDIGGFTRMVFGFPRSFIDMSNDGVMFKRFLLHDPFNPVFFFDLFRLSLWKLLLFYLLLGLVVLALARSERGRRFLALLVLSGAPVIAFAWMWQGGAIERYLPLYPAIFLAFAYLLSHGPWLRLCRLTAMAWMVTALFSNSSAMAKPVLAERQERVVARVEELQRRWKPQSLVATVIQQDGVWALYWTFPFHPINRGGSLAVYHILEPGTTRIPSWRQSFAAQALSVWAAGGDLWVSKRAFSVRPKAEWDWVEGNDPRISWHDLQGFFSQIETGTSVGGDDGFFLFSPSPRNREFFTRWVGF